MCWSKGLGMHSSSMITYAVYGHTWEGQLALLPYAQAVCLRRMFCSGVLVAAGCAVPQVVCCCRWLCCVCQLCHVRLACSERVWHCWVHVYIGLLLLCVPRHSAIASAAVHPSMHVRPVRMATCSCISQALHHCIVRLDTIGQWHISAALFA